MEQNKKPKKKQRQASRWIGEVYLFCSIRSQGTSTREREGHKTTGAAAPAANGTKDHSRAFTCMQRCLATEGARATKAAHRTAPDGPVPTERDLKEPFQAGTDRTRYAPHNVT